MAEAPSSAKGPLDHGLLDSLYIDPKEQKAAEHRTKVKVGILIGVSVAVIFAIGGVIGAYYAWPQPFTAFFTQQIAVANGLLYFAVPLLAAGILIRLVIHVAKTYQTEKESVGILAERVSIWGATAKALAPTKQQAIKTCIALAAMAIVAVGLYFLLTKLPAANEWLNQSVISNNIQMWQAFAYIGGGTTVLVVTTFVAHHFISKKIQENEDKKRLVILDGQILATETPD